MRMTRLTPEQVKKRVEGMLLEELKAGQRDWYFISCANAEGFGCGFYVEAFGPTDAFRLSHALGLYPEGSGCETLTLKVSPDKVHKIPQGHRWRRLTREEIMSIDTVGNMEV